MDKILENLSKIESDFTTLEASSNEEVLKRNEILKGHIRLLSDAKLEANQLLVLLRTEIGHNQEEEAKVKKNLADLYAKIHSLTEKMEDDLDAAKKEVEEKGKTGIALDAKNKKLNSIIEALEIERSELSTSLVNLQKEVNKTTSVLKNQAEQIKQNEEKIAAQEKEIGDNIEKNTNLTKEISVKDERIIKLNNK